MQAWKGSQKVADSAYLLAEAGRREEEEAKSDGPSGGWQCRALRRLRGRREAILL